MNPVVRRWFFAVRTGCRIAWRAEHRPLRMYPFRFRAPEWLAPSDLIRVSVPARRIKLPSRRVNDGPHELTIGEHKLYVTFGLYPNDTPGEIWLDTSKEGSDLRAFISGFAIVTSLLMQYGATPDDIAHSLEKLSGGPSGEVKDHETIKSARSMIDLVAQLLRQRYGAKR